MMSMTARLCVAVATVALFALPVHGKPNTAKLEADLQSAFECKAYTQILPELGDPVSGRRIHAYWTDTSNRIGKSLGLSAQAIEMKSLIIPITADKAPDVLSRCVRATPKKIMRAR